ncbi:serine hydrolase [Streptomyces sp. VRA16 Mangrove soil]|uniref:serine hydrolase domain-containing protein n=1 Tax=Streptomyces sp. VRA16 Mangrove soil TaxID=2817434 RepID=UPI001E50A32A|nr:serine hydrolase domain-containing protein [Streptomyces sp. VRA16 Mangrove soil]
MKRRAFLALSTALAAAPVLSGTAVAAAPRTTGGLDTAALRAALAGLPDDDATAALVRVGGTDGTWHGAGGVHDLASGRAALPGARFRAGSTTKVVTAATVLRLAAARRIDLDAPVQHYLPRLFRSTAFHRPISVRHLLNHTSGIRSGDGWGDAFADQYAHRFDVLPVSRVVASALAKGPAFAPGEQQDYLNINYTLLGLLAERVTGEPFADVATRLVLRPAGMRATYFPGSDPDVRGPHNHGYQLVDGAFVDVTRWVQTDRFAAGDMISTTADLERLLFSLFRGRLVPAPQLREMFTVPAGIDGATMSAGLQRIDLGDRTFWGKSGARYGYSAALAATRDLSRTLVYSVNATDAKGEEMNPVAARIVGAAVSDG